LVDVEEEEEEDEEEEEEGGVLPAWDGEERDQAGVDPEVLSPDDLAVIQAVAGMSPL